MLQTTMMDIYSIYCQWFNKTLTFTCTCMQNLIFLWNCVLPKLTLEGKKQVYIINEIHLYSSLSHIWHVHSIEVNYHFFFITSGNNPIVVNNTQCRGLYSFVNFKASAVCFTNPLITGRYVRISNVRGQALQLCEVEIYLRGTFH